MKVSPSCYLTGTGKGANELLSGTGMAAVLKANQLPVNERFVGLADNLHSNNFYLQLGGQLAAAYHAHSARA